MITESREYSILILKFWQGRRDSNSRPTVLETVALPTELHPYFGAGEGNRTLVTSLEGWGFTTKLHPLIKLIFQIPCDIFNVNILNMTYILYHNPSCSKSRICLQLLIKKKVHFKKRLYVTEPFSLNEISELVDKFSGDLEQLLRGNKFNFDIKNKQLLKDYLINNPAKLQRPIFFNGKKFTVCRPPELVISLIED